jgi:hypothetical protein
LPIEGFGTIPRIHGLKLADPDVSPRLPQVLDVLPRFRHFPLEGFRAQPIRTAETVVNVGRVIA